MKEYSLKFYGYTWDDFFFPIASNGGILLVYSGKLDLEGFTKMSKILYVGWASRLGKIYNDPIIDEIRNNLSNNEQLFFSYASIGEMDSLKVLPAIINAAKPIYNVVNQFCDKVLITCEGACDFIPKTIAI